MKHFSYNITTNSNSSSETLIKYHTVENIKALAVEMGSDNFLNWLSGFTDGEGTFFIKHEIDNFGKQKKTFLFKITLNVDDYDTLKRIELELSRLAGTSVGNVTKNGVSATYKITDFKFIRALIVPILMHILPFYSFFLYKKGVKRIKRKRTAKYFDFVDWAQVLI